MIPLSEQFDLGRDTTRIKDRRDADRQSLTARQLLARLFHPKKDQRWELQLLADEVGMGKTFVSLAVAYSVLQAMGSGRPPGDLEGCYRKVLIVTPHNHSLFTKWEREVSEFVRRCVLPEHQPDAQGWFKPTSVDRIDDLVKALRRPGNGGGVVVAKTGIFGLQKLMHYDLKRRFMLGVLFRHWGNRFGVPARERLLRGAPEGWPGNPYALTTLSEKEAELLPWTEEQALDALGRLDQTSHASQATLEKLLVVCQEISEPYQRSRDEQFKRVATLLVEVYRDICMEMLRSDLPLVIVDEAHNWKNGPSDGKNGYAEFRRAIACRTRRMLLLTATPFQLRPQEILELLRIMDDMHPGLTRASSSERVEFLRAHREQVVSPVLQYAAQASRSFSRAWTRLPLRVRPEALQVLWDSRPLEAARAELRRMAHERGALSPAEVDPFVRRVVLELDPEVRDLFREALRLFTFNADLSEEMGKQVIRHRRKTEHRLFRVGDEFQQETAEVAARADRHLLHAAPGIDVRGDGELPHYLLMRCVTEMHREQRRVRRSSLGTALTGCYSTLLESAEGKNISRALRESPAGSVYLDLLMGMVDAKQDAEHPKVKALTEHVIRAWHAGEKTLIFCFRNNTARRLRDILGDRIHSELKARRQRCLGGENSMKGLRNRLTRRDGDLVVLGLDRVLLSYAWVLRAECGSTRLGNALALGSDEVEALARVGLRHGVRLDEEDVDRVFLNRATEHVLARKLLREGTATGRWKLLLEQLSQPEWVESPYGLTAHADAEGAGEDAASFDERGVHALYPVGREPTDAEVAELARIIESRRGRARRNGAISIYDAYLEAPSLWLGTQPMAMLEGGSGLSELVQSLQAHLDQVSWEKDAFEWDGRRRVLQALRRAVLRESVLIRLLPERTRREESGWGELLVSAFFEPMLGQLESMAHRVAAFLEDVSASSGSFQDARSARSSFLEATRLRNGTFVSLVSGETDSATRERAFAGFNSPLLPEVLICTSVGAEGIDLHRHCRHVIHYDLAWNPAVVEQRTGRVDRIGSKTFRERQLARPGTDIFLGVSVPFLAGTYDERMFEELRLRAQMFEVLTGGDVSADNVEGRDDMDEAEGNEDGVRLVSLPARIIDDLRVRLHVWEDPGDAPSARSHRTASVG
jgi:hypothetical protein